MCVFLLQVTHTPDTRSLTVRLVDSLESTDSATVPRPPPSARRATVGDRPHVYRGGARLVRPTAPTPLPDSPASRARLMFTGRLSVFNCEATPIRVSPRLARGKDDGTHCRQPEFV